eukprot:2637165-Ditylum_brightwellii.AAC.1
MLDAPEFWWKYPCPLDTHSTRKYGMTQCRQNGYHTNEENYHWCFKEGSWITDAWIYEYVCPSIKKIYGDGIAALLGKAVLWAMFDIAFMELVPQAWCHVFVAEYNKITFYHCIADGENPVEKHCCVPWEHEDILHIDIINEDGAWKTDGVAISRFLGSAEASAQISAIHNIL